MFLGARELWVGTVHIFSPLAGVPNLGPDGLGLDTLRSHPMTFTWPARQHHMESTHHHLSHLLRTKAMDTGWHDRPGRPLESLCRPDLMMARQPNVIWPARASCVVPRPPYADPRALRRAFLRF